MPGPHPRVRGRDAREDVKAVRRSGATTRTANGQGGGVYMWTESGEEGECGPNASNG